MIISTRKCASCGGTQFAEGRLGIYRHTFIPRGEFMFFGHTVLGAVCLDCGIVQHSISEADRAELRKKAHGSLADSR